MTHLSRRGLALSAVAMLLLTWSSVRAAVRPSWDALPPETVVMLRVPAGNDFLAALRKQTKFGAVALSQQRLDKLAAIFKEESKDDFDKAQADLAKYNLKIEDWHDVFAGEAGMALAVLPRTGQKPQIVGLAWFEPAGDLSERLVKAIQKSVDEHKGQMGWPDERVDSVIEGHDVTRVTTWIIAPEPAATLAPAPADGPPIAPNQQGSATPEAPHRAATNIKTVQVDQTHLLITRIGNRVVMGWTFPQSSAETLRQLAAGKKVDLAAASGLEAATGLFARFLAAHTTRDNAQSVPATLMAAPGLAAALPPGMVGVEALADLHQIIKLTDDGTDPKVGQVIKGLGLDTPGPAGFRYALDGNVLRSGGFLSLPAPRSGLMTLLDQAPLNPEPPAWAPTSATAFGQASFDVGKAYLRVKELALAQGDPQMGAYFQMAEAGVLAQLGTDLPTLLSSLGHVHSFLTLLPQTKAAAAPAAGPPPAPGAGHHANVAPPAQQRVSIVWQLTDGPLWQKVFQLIGQNMGGNAPVKEQGFTGWRFPIPNGMGPIALFLNDKYLTVAVGPEVAEATMSWLRAAPEGKDALRTSDTFQRAKTIMPLEPCILYAISDGARSSRSTRDVLTAAIDQWAQVASRHGPHIGAPGDADDDDEDDDEPAAPGAPGSSGGAKPVAPHVAALHHDPKAMAAKLKSILPTDEEVDGMLGVGVQQVVVKTQGVQVSGVVELPPLGGQSSAQPLNQSPESPTAQMSHPTKITSAEMHDAVKAGDLEKVKAFLANGGDVNATNGNGSTALAIAAINGHKDIAELLLAKGANVNAKANHGETPLQDAALKGHKEIVELLLAKGADISAKADDGATPLFYAVVGGQKDVAELLLAKSAGADVNLKRNDGMTPLLYVAASGRKDIAELLLAKGADVSMKSKHGLTALHYTAAYGHKDLAELLLAKGADVNAKDEDGDTPLHNAIQRHHDDVVELLRAHGGKE